MSGEGSPQPVLLELEAELLGDCKWTLRQNQSVITSLKRENKELKAALVSLTPAASSRQALVQAELHSLNIQVNDLRKHHDKLVQDRLRGTNRLAQLRDSIKDLESDSQLVFKESPGSQLVKSLDKKLTAALAKHDTAQSACQELEQNAQALRDHQSTHNSQLCSLEEAVADRQAELQDVLAAHAAMHQTQELAKAELATVEQQLLVQRAARTAQLEQHASQVRQQQEQCTALHQAAAERLQHWRKLLQTTQGNAASVSHTGSSAADAALSEAAAAAPDAAVGAAAEQQHAVPAQAQAVASSSEDGFEGTLTTAAAEATPAPASLAQEEVTAPTTSSATAIETEAMSTSIQLENTEGELTNRQTADSSTADIAAGVESAQIASSSQDKSILDAAATSDKASALAAGALTSPAEEGLGSVTSSAADTMGDTLDATSDQAPLPNQAVTSGQADMPDQAMVSEQAALHESASASRQNSIATVGTSGGALPEGALGPDLTCRQAFAALQYATGVADVAQLVDRFLAQDSTWDALQQLQQETVAYLQHMQQRSSDLQARVHKMQHMRQSIHKQAEAAIEEAQAQQELNASQYEHAGRSLVHIKATLQTLIEKLQPLFPEMALQRATNESLCDAIHSCGSCLKQAQLSLEGVKKQIGFVARATDGDESTGVPELHSHQVHPQFLSIFKGARSSLDTDASFQTAEQQIEPIISTTDATAPVGTVSLLSQPDIV